MQSKVNGITPLQIKLKLLGVLPYRINMQVRHASSVVAAIAVSAVASSVGIVKECLRVGSSDTQQSGIVRTMRR